MRFDPTAVDRARLALFLRRRAERLAASEFKNLETLSAELERLAASPTSWGDLDQQWISLLAFHQLLSHAATEDPQHKAEIMLLYSRVVSALGTDARLALEDEIARQLESTKSDVLTLGPFMFLDPDPAVVATAALDAATLMPLENGDPLTGPRMVAQEAMARMPANETRAAALIAGLLLLGDARVLPLVTGCWQRLGQAGKDVLREQQSGWVFASQAELFLRWIESANEDDFGHPVGALGRLAEGMIRHPGVRDVERKFPAPFNLPDEEFFADPPFRLIQEWTKEEFASLIEPRLRVAYMRENYDKVIPRVLRAWGLEVGADNRDDQERRIVQSYEQAAKRLSEYKPVESGLDSSAREAMEETTAFFQDQPAPHALFSALQEMWLLQKEAGELRERAHEDASGPLLEVSQRLDDRAQTMQRLLQRYFGAFPENVGSALGTMVLLWSKHRPAEAKGSLPNTSWIKQVPIEFWSEFVQAALLHLLAHGETTAIKQAEKTAGEFMVDATQENIARKLRELADEKLTEAKALAGAAFLARTNKMPNVDAASLILRAFATEAESRGLRAQAERATR
jgi:hypothetical protein